MRRGERLEQRANAELTELRRENERLRAAVELAEAARGALEQSELRMRLIVEGITGHAITMLDPEGLILTWNREAERIKGFSLDEVNGRYYGMLFTPEDRRKGEPAVELEIARVRGRYEGEGQRLRKDGTAFDAAISLSAIRDEHGVLRGFVKVTRDVTGVITLKRTQELLHVMAEASVMLASSFGYEATLASVASLAVPRLADWAVVHITVPGDRPRRIAVAHADPKKKEIGEAILDRIEVRADAASGPLAVIRAGQSQIATDFTERDIDRAGEIAPMLRSLGICSWMCVPIKVRGRVAGALSLASAESKRHFSEVDLATAEDLVRRAGQAIDNAESYRATREASRLKDEFLATVSHELRTPLNVILGWASLLRQKTDEPLAAHGLDVIQRNARAQAVLVEDVLDVSRIIGGKLRVEPRRVDLVAVARIALDVVMPMARAKQVAIDLESSTPEVALDGDPDRLRQVIWNLATNAVKFTPPGGRVTISITREPDSIVLRVTDTGCGISEAFLPYVFDRFSQADGTTTRAYAGLGLGLAIVRHIVELHGGTVVAESPGEGRGSTFTVRLPAAMQPSPRAPTTEEHAPIPASSPPPARALDRLRVLVCDDEIDSLDVVAQVLTAQGAEVVAVPTAREALSAVESFRPEVIVADLAMPEMDGYDLIHRVRERPEAAGGKTPALALTAYARAEDARQAVEAGFQLHAAKPIEASALVALVGNLGGRAPQP